MKIDLRPDAAAIKSMLRDSAARYAKMNASDAKKNPPVTRLDFTFWLGDGGPAPPYILLNLDTRPDAEPDGEWSHAEFATLERPNWKSAIDAALDGEEEVEATLADGSAQPLSGDNLEQTIGEFLVAVIKSARDEGSLQNLPMAENCELGVEESGGSFGWPRYEDRGKENLASSKASPLKPRNRTSKKTPARKPTARKPRRVEWKTEKKTGDLVLFVLGQEAGRLTRQQLAKIKADKDDLFSHQEKLEIAAGLDQ